MSIGKSKTMANTKWPMVNGQCPGFTMVEVMVALAIAAGALILLITTNQAGIGQSIRSRRAMDLDALCDSKLDELRLLGKEAPNSGEFEHSLKGWRWRLRRAKQRLKGLSGLKRWTLKVYSPEQPFRPIKTVSTIAYEDGVKKAQ